MSIETGLFNKNEKNHHVFNNNIPLRKSANSIKSLSKPKDSYNMLIQYIISIDRKYYQVWKGVKPFEMCLKNCICCGNCCWCSGCCGLAACWIHCCCFVNNCCVDSDHCRIMRENQCNQCCSRYDDSLQQDFCCPGFAGIGCHCMFCGCGMCPINDLREILWFDGGDQRYDPDGWKKDMFSSSSPQRQTKAPLATNQQSAGSARIAKEGENRADLRRQTEMSENTETPRIKEESVLPAKAIPQQNRQQDQQKQENKN